MVERQIRLNQLESRESRSNQDNFKSTPQMRTFMNSGGNSKGDYSPATVKSIIPTAEITSNQTLTKHNPMLSYAVSGGVKFDSKEAGSVPQSRMDSRLRSDAGFQQFVNEKFDKNIGSFENINQLNTMSNDTVQDYYQRSKNKQHQKVSRNDALRTSTEDEDRIKMRNRLTPSPIQDYLLQRENTIGPTGNSQQINQYQYQQPIEVQAQRSFPLRQPSVSPSPILSGSGQASRSHSRSRSPIQNHNQQQIAGGQSKDSLQMHHLQQNVGQTPIPEQESAQEISSIVKPKNQLTVTNVEDSQYVFTSQQNSSIIEEDHEKFVFNTNALKSNIREKHHEIISQEELGHIYGFGDDGESEPQIQTQTNRVKCGDLISYNQTRRSEEDGTRSRQQNVYQEQIKNSSRNVGEAPQSIHNPQGSRHHTGGSFGNLRNQNQSSRQPICGGGGTIGQLNSDNSFVKLERMLQVNSKKLNGEPDSVPNSRFNSNNPILDYNNIRNNTTRERSSQQKVRINLDDQSPEQDQMKKYQIKQNHNRTKSNGRADSRSRSNTAPDEQVEFYGDNSGRRSHSNKRGKNLRKRTLSSSIERKVFMPIKKDNSKMSSDTESLPENTSQISLSQKSKGSYGKYFIKSRKLMNNRNIQEENDKKLKRDKLISKSEKSRSFSISKSRSREPRERQRKSKERSKSKISKKSEKSQSKKKQLRANSTRELQKTKKMEKTKIKSKTSSIHERSQSANRVLNTVKRSQLPGKPPVPNAFATISKENIQTSLNTINHSSHNLIVKTPKNLMTIQPKKEKNSSQKDGTKDDSSLAQNLLVDLAKKYKNMDKNQVYATPGTSAGIAVQRAQMISEIQSLAQALIKSEKRICKMKLDNKAQSKKLKTIIQEQEECITLLQSKFQKYEIKYQKIKRNDERAQFELEKEGQKHQNEKEGCENVIDELQRRIQIEKSKFDKEKREIIINMERDLQKNLQKQQQKYEIKINSLQSVNDQLNVKLQAYQSLESNFEKLQIEYQQSLQILNEYQEQFSEQNNHVDDLNRQISDLHLKLEHQEAQSLDQIDELNLKLVQQQSRHDQKIQQLKQTHNCDLQKNKLNVGQLEDSQKFNFEVEINNLRLALKQKDQQILNLNQTIDQTKSQLTQERTRFKNSEKQIMDQNTQLEEQRNRLEQEAGDLEIQVQQIQRRLQIKENDYENLKLRSEQIGDEKQIMTPPTSRSDNDKDQIINELRMKLEKNNEIIYSKNQAIKKKNEQMANMEQDTQKKMQLYLEKIELQQQEIQILAQGFQAQQAKLNSQKSLKTFNGNSTSQPQTYLDTGLNNDIKEVNSERERKNVMNIQSQSSTNEFDENYGSEIQQSEKNLYFQNNNYKQNRQNIIEAEKAATIINDDGEESESLTDRQLEQMSPEIHRQIKSHQMRVSSHTFGNYQNTESHNYASAESLDDSQENKKVILTQKEEEIKILLNVINQLKQKGGDDAVLRGIVNKVGNVGKMQTQNLNRKNESQENMSSIMNINGPNQYQSAGTDDVPSSNGILKYTQIEEAYDENDSCQENDEIRILDNNQESQDQIKFDCEDYGSTPVIKNKGLVTFSAKTASTNKKELVDVKKRIDQLMGPKNVLSVGSTQPFEVANSNRQGGNSSRSDSIGQYNFKSKITNQNQ